MPVRANSRIPKFGQQPFDGGVFALRADDGYGDRGQRDVNDRCPEDVCDLNDFVAHFTGFCPYLDEHQLPADGVCSGASSLTEWTTEEFAAAGCTIWAIWHVVRHAPQW